MRLKTKERWNRKNSQALFLFAVISNHPFTNFLVSNQLELTRLVFRIMLFASTLVEKKRTNQPQEQQGSTEFPLESSRIL